MAIVVIRLISSGVERKLIRKCFSVVFSLFNKYEGSRESYKCFASIYYWVIICSVNQNNLFVDVGTF